MNREQKYKVARHLFSIQIESESDLWNHLSNYAPFIANISDERESLFTLSIEEDETILAPTTQLSLGRFDSDGACIEIFTTAEGGRMFLMFPHSKDAVKGSRLYISSDFSQARLLFDSDAHASHRLFALTNSLMLLYALATATLDTLLMHASVVVSGAKAYIFLGRSGTGKSTHSGLWLQHIVGSTLLNDDNPVIRIAADGTPEVYGTPWSGKTPCYLNEHAPLGAIVRLSQAPTNKIDRLKGAVAYAAVSPSLSAMRWERDMADGIHATMAKLTDSVSIYHLQCLPDEAAALLCADRVREEKSCSE